MAGTLAGLEALTAMITADELLIHLKALAPSQEASALDEAGAPIDEFLSGLSGEPSERAATLAGLQARFQRETSSSVMRSEILDLLSDRVMRLLESN